MRGITLDHVAIALETWRVGFPRFVYELGGRWKSGGYAPGFAFAQVKYANAMVVELLIPHQVEQSDFLRRFLDTNVAGPHHLTFNVDDIHEAIDALRAAGIEPYGVNLQDPDWMEMFVHPKSAPTWIVVQVAESHEPEDGSWVGPPPAGYPPELPPAASLVRVGHAVADLDATLAIFRDVLRGEPVDEGADDAGPWVDLAWPGPGRVRLLSAAAGPLAEWIGRRAGRLHHLAFAMGDPAAAEGAMPLADDTFELAPDEATGTRVLLLPRS